MWHINDDEAIPPLPLPLTPAGGSSRQAEAYPQGLKPGCWVVLLDPVFADDVDPNLSADGILKGWTVGYQGTLRVAEDRRISGDLYVERQLWSVPGPREFPKLEKPSRIPIYSLRNYAIYFTLQNLTLNLASKPATGTARIATFRYDSETFTWGPAEVLTAHLENPKNIPKEWRTSAAKGEYLCWTIHNDRQTNVGRLEMGWITPHLREARIEIARARLVKAPLDGGEGTTIQKAFETVGWSVEVPDPVVTDGPPDIWAVSELHAKMLELRSVPDLDRAWIYHVLVVPRWREEVGPDRAFGLLYDSGSLDTNMVPREGIVVAAAARFLVDAKFGSASGQKLEDVPRAAFHNLMHELGHTMGLLHRFRGRTFMQGTLYVADQKTARLFPESLDLAYDTEDIRRLLHYPDIQIRPGGAPFGQDASALPVPDADAITDVSDQFDLAVRPLRPKVPWGAPVRLQLRLTNTSSVTLPGPARLGLSAGSVAGRVIGPDGRLQIFAAVSPVDSVGTADLAPGKSLYQGETLLRGPQGALFPVPGRYRIEVEAGWVGPGGIPRVGGHCEILVTPPRNRRHNRVALDLLSSPDLSILLIFRPSPNSEDPALRETLRVLKRALKTPELRGSFAPIEARRWADIDLKKAARLIDEDSLLTTSEIDDLLIAVRKAGRRARKHGGICGMLKIFRAKARLAFCKDLAPRSLLDLAEESLRCHC
jgi:hypothetical protein